MFFLFLEVEFITINFPLRIVFASSHFPGSDGKVSAYNVGGLDLIPGLGRSPGKGNGNPLQYPFLENLMDRGAWWATVHRVSKESESDTTCLLNNGSF